ncbi:MAG TPA: lipoprotein-releasing system ATP-binding protein LolD, partial [Gammaproteobacteria bacterium]|nr:lipoprotein-releasing system ATP-binding protein LolD [Gammaproteobacteria bacterium]
MSDHMILTAQGLHKSFYQSAVEVPVLNGVDLQLVEGEH